MDFTKLIFRKATKSDLTRIVEMLRSDFLGKDREYPDEFAFYEKAFVEIDSDKNNFLSVMEFEGEVIGTCHLTIMPSLTLSGSKRMAIDAVRVDEKYSGKGIGTYMMQKAIEFARKNEVKIVQLTTNKKRQRVHEFYKRLGFEASHEGMKLQLASHE